jgi:DNA-3-methyladenine glycosylase I
MGRCAAVGHVRHVKHRVHLDGGVILLLAVGNQQGWIARVFRIRWLRELGIVSYCVHIIHIVVNVVVHAAVLHKAPRISTPKGAVLTVLAAFATYGFAKASSMLFEAPLQRRGHAFRYRVRLAGRESMPSRRKSPSNDSVIRCHWASNEWNIPYHDTEWGVPVHDDRLLFEFLILEGAQAGLSWDTILRKRERYRKVFDNFDVQRVARYDAKKVRALLADPGIIRNRLKISATIGNAREFIKVQKEFGSFDAYIWQFVGGKPKINRWTTPQRVPGKTPESDALSRDLMKRGFRFVGSTICYAFMQATGIVNDHAISCFRYRQV